MSVKLMSLVWESHYSKHIINSKGVESKSHAKLLVMLKLADSASDEGWCWPSQQTIADQCGISRQTVNEMIKLLESDGKLVLDRAQYFNRMQLLFTDLDSPRNIQKHSEIPDVASADILKPASDVGSADSRCRLRAIQMSAHPTQIIKNHKEPSERGQPSATPAAVEKSPDPVEEVFEHFRQKQKPGCELAPRRKYIVRALKTNTPARLKLAIDGSLRDDWIMGRDKRSVKKYNDLDTIFRDDLQIDKMVELAGGEMSAAGPAAKPPGVFGAYNPPTPWEFPVPVLGQGHYSQK